MNIRPLPQRYRKQLETRGHSLIEKSAKEILHSSPRRSKITICDGCGAAFSTIGFGIKIYYRHSYTEWLEYKNETCDEFIIREVIE